jgi:hypothetical protein
MIWIIDPFYLRHPGHTRRRPAPTKVLAHSSQTRAIPTTAPTIASFILGIFLLRRFADRLAVNRRNFNCSVIAVD